eukprot:15476875-Alexandrium_andersonii.AAC.1
MSPRTTSTRCHTRSLNLRATWTGAMSCGKDGVHTHSKAQARRATLQDMARNHTIFATDRVGASDDERLHDACVARANARPTSRDPHARMHAMRSTGAGLPDRRQPTS